MKPSVPTCRGNKAGRDRRKHFSLSRGNDNTALHSYIITFLLFTQNTAHSDLFFSAYMAFQKLCGSINSYQS